MRSPAFRQYGQALFEASELFLLVIYNVITTGSKILWFPSSIRSDNNRCGIVPTVGIILNSGLRRAGDWSHLHTTVGGRSGTAIR